MQIRKILGYYWPHVKKYKWSFAAPFVFYAIATVVNHVATPIVYKSMIDAVSSGQVPADIAPWLMTLVLILLGIQISNQTFYRLGDYTLVYVQSKIIKLVADSALVNLHRHSYKFFADTFGGSLVSKVNRFTDSFEVLHDSFIYNVWMNGLVLIGIFSSLLWFAPVLAALFLTWLLLFIVVTFTIIKYKTPIDLIHAKSRSETTGVLADIITNVSNLKMFSSGDREEEAFSKVTAAQEKKRVHAWYFDNHQVVAQALLISGFEILAMYVAIKLWISGSISSGTIVLLQVYLLKIFDLVWNIGKNATRMVQAVADAKEMVDIFETPIDVEDIENPEVCKIKAGEINVQNIGFSYHSGESKGESIFKDFSLSVNSGEKIGLVGHSGSGKTTITKLLLRFMDVDNGEILIDGQDIAKIKQDDLRRNISYVPQDPILFHRSLRDNIAYGKSDASEAEIVEAAKAANAHEFISTLPDGYDTLVGERGIKLSGGERQRVAIARAMLKDAPILILDEATSALDSISERHIQEAFGRLMQGRTTLAIAHRLSTIQKMDRIVVFDKGSIVEQGTHAELTKNDGVYAELWQEQSSGFIE